MLSVPGALLFVNLHIIFIISSGETGLQNILFLVVYEQYFSKSNCPQGCNDCTKFAPIEQKYSFKLLHISLGSMMSLLLYVIFVILVEFRVLERASILFKLFHNCLVVF